MAREPVLPTLRAAMFAAVCVMVGAGAHRVMSPGAVPAWALLVGGVGSYLPARFAAARGERGLAGIGALLLGLQAALHLLFCYAQHVGASGGFGAPAASGASLPTSMPMTMPMPMPGMPAAASGRASVGMLIAHALAAVLCAWWLRRGEAALHAVVRGALFRLRATWPVLPAAAPPADLVSRSGSVRVGSRPRTLRSQWSRSLIAQRGPPLAPTGR